MISKQDIQDWFNEPFDFAKAIYLLGGLGIDTRNYARYLSARYVPDWVQHTILKELSEAWRDMPEQETASKKVVKETIHSTRAVRLLKERSQLHALMRLYAENNQPQQAYEAAQQVLHLSTEINEIYGTDYYNQKDMSEAEAAERAVVIDTVKKMQLVHRIKLRIRKYRSRKQDTSELEQQLKQLQNELLL